MSKGLAVKILKITLPIVLGVFLIWYSLSQLSFADIIQYAKNADYKYILLGVFFGLLSHLSRAYRWLFMLEPLGYKIKLGNSIMAVFATYLINYTIPRAGEVARATILTNYENVPFEKGFGTIVAERIADMIVMLGIIAITLFLQFDFIYSFLIDKFDFTKIILAGLILLVLGLFFILFIKRSQSKIALKIKGFVSGLIEGALSIFKMKKKWAFICHTLFIWTMYVLMFYVTTLAFPDLNTMPFGAVLIGFILASFSIAATNGGIGSYPEAIVIAFSLFNLPVDPSRAFGWIMWSSQTILVFVFGGISLLYLPFFNRNK
ncbi:lysylphosphatidylglycerol synthase transmembrane domain-containing protein [Olleya marilimosa]|uniref:Flippase-like domain-containing protein n=1 Tax=Olleya marilimosa TaxID=272164 RepID=A0ABR8LU41_9FLAO|nr:lysylphosphatidylglycerol synthase transmembrane domain-containing protein [Olleya marilimosa]MBD3862893.1 flippase-like domain-containing protein [Olleya marilimosa]MBD3890388.1 flippase-like domain-containing protein [Olleya marilimosa]|tara:strand:- start:319906 stop:320862 length:957 start_codon:yes stop_codon:yes gene_type:complete